VLKVLHQLLGTPGRDDPRFKLMKAIFTAIVRHHSPMADSYREFTLHKAAFITLAQVLTYLDPGGQTVKLLVMSKRPQSISSLLVQPEIEDELLAYFLIVRALRLADQRALSKNEEQINE